MAKKKSSNRRRKASNKIRNPLRPKWMRNLGLIVGIIFSILAVVLVVMSIYRYYHLISHH